MQADVKLLFDREHYDRVVRDGILRAARYVWIATANAKDLHVERRGRYVSILAEFEKLAAAGVAFRIIHGARPSAPFSKDLSGRRGLANGQMELLHCIRCHMKLILVDGRRAYFGSANFTGAGIGAKGETRRNFEVGIWTEDAAMVEALGRRFDDLWMGRFCSICGRRKLCPNPIQ